MKYTLTENWNTYLDYFPAGSKDTYFTEEYVKLYENNGDVAICFVCNEDNKYLLFPFLKREFTFEGKTYYDFETAYGYGGPIVNTNDTEFIESALEQFSQYCKDNNYVCGFVRFHPLLSNINGYDTIGKLLIDRTTVAVDLSMSENEIWMNELTSKNRNTIKKAISNGLQFIVDTEFKYLPEFISIYNRTMRKLGADDFYIFEDQYYNDWVKKINNSFLGVVLFNDVVVSGAIFFYSEEYGHYHLSGSDAEYLYLNPNNFMLWEATKELKKLGVKKFHLGGGSSGDEKNSLLEFKSRFSKNKYTFHIGKTMFDADVYNAICIDWEKNNPEKAVVLKNHLLKYKY